jgi:hypothetical protein
MVGSAAAPALTPPPLPLRWERGSCGRGRQLRTVDTGAGHGISRFLITVGIAWCGVSYWAPQATTGALASPIPNERIECDVPPRTLDEIALLLESNIATPTATTGGLTIPEGTPADLELGAAMEATVRTWLACQNAGEQLRAWALFSDGYLVRLLSRHGGTPDASLATPAPPAEDAATLLEVRDERILPDGRSGATVTIAYPSVPMPKTFFFTFTGSADNLLIDGILGEISFSVP